MGYSCFRCSKDLDLSEGSRVGRRDSCPHCSADLHACRNCTHYDPSSYNECREPQADRVLEKDRSNFCDYFKFSASPRPGTGAASKIPGKSEQLKKLDDLFKKPDAK